MSSLIFLLFFLNIFSFIIWKEHFFFIDKQWIASLGTSVSFCSLLYWYNSCVLFCIYACGFWLVIKKITLSCSGVIGKWKHCTCYHWWAMNFLNYYLICSFSFTNTEPLIYGFWRVMWCWGGIPDYSHITKTLLYSWLNLNNTVLEWVDLNPVKWQARDSQVECIISKPFNS